MAGKAEIEYKLNSEMEELVHLIYANDAAALSRNIKRYTSLLDVAKSLEIDTARYVESISPYVETINGGLTQ